MSISHDVHIESVLKKQVYDVNALVKSGQYSKALGTARSAKAIYPKNIFIIALEKQLEKLQALSDTPALSDPERQKELLASIPTLIQRSIEGMEKDEPMTPPASQPSGEREAAFAKLKDEYFQLADRLVANGDYNQAIQEIKRVLILEPENPSAREYLEKIQELLQLKEKSGTKRLSTHEDSPRESHPAVRTPTKIPEPKQVVRRETPGIATTPQSGTTISENSRAPISKKLIVAAMPVLLVAIAAVYFFTRSDQVDQNPAADSAQKNESAAQNMTEKGIQQTDAAKLELSQRKDVQSVSTPSGTQQSGNLQAMNVQPPAAASKETTATKKPNSETALTTKDVSAPVGSRTSPAKEQLKTGTEGSPATTPGKLATKSGETDNEAKNPEVNTRSQENRAQDPVTEEPKITQLAKLDVKQGVQAAKPIAQTLQTIALTERKAEIVRLVNPQFPESALRAGIQGEVLVRVQIDPDGKPVQAKIVRSTSTVFNDAVIEAVMHSTYSPGVMSSGPVTSWITLPFTFKMKK